MFAVLVLVATNRRSEACTALTISSSGTAIVTAGAYCLTSNVTFTPTSSYATAIAVNVPTSAPSNQVVIDLGGYEIRCTGGSCNTASGVYSQQASGLVVQNGKLTDFNIGVYLYSGYSANIHDMTFDIISSTTSLTGVYQDGLFSSAVIEHNLFFSMSNGVYLYGPSGGSAVRNNTFIANGYGVYYNQIASNRAGGMVIGNWFSPGGLYAIYANPYPSSGGALVYRDNAAFGGGYYCAANCAYFINQGNNTSY